MPTLIHRSSPDDNPIVFWPTPDEYKAIRELVELQGLTEQQVMRQAVRQYQMVVLGHATLTVKDILGGPHGLPAFE